MTQIINLIGPPGAGKSTIAAGLFFNMKLASIEVELVTEYAKDMVWEERNNILMQQEYIFAKQHRRISRLIGKVDFIITDSPLYLSLIYTPPSFPDSFRQFIKDIAKSYDNKYFYINRIKRYNPNGRNHTEEESNQVGLNIRNFLIENKIEFEMVDGDRNAPFQIIDSLGFFDQK